MVMYQEGSLWQGRVMESGTQWEVPTRRRGLSGMG